MTDSPSGVGARRCDYPDGTLCVRPVGYSCPSCAPVGARAPQLKDQDSRMDTPNNPNDVATAGKGEPASATSTVTAEDGVHTGDDDLLDRLTGIRAAVEQALEDITDPAELREALGGALEELDAADRLRLAEIRSRQQLSVKDIYAEGINVGMELGRALATGGRVLDSPTTGNGVNPHVGARAQIEPLEQLIAKWRADADRSKLLQGLDCANELEAFLRAGPAQTEAGALLRGLADVADGRVRSLDDIDAELSGPAQKDQQ